MSIPPLDHRVLLPEGIYEAHKQEIKKSFCITLYRQKLFDDFIRFLDIEIHAQGIGVYLGGSFFSDKPLPNDIEVTITVDAEMLSDKTKQHVVNLGAPAEHARIKKIYRVDFYLSIDWAGYNDFRQFFQYVGEKTANAKGLNARDKRGIVKLQL
jgi:hypothetical protein